MNNKSRDLELEKQIDAYVKGRLTEEEAIQLWATLLQRPEYIELLETELGIKAVVDKQAKEQDTPAGNDVSREPEQESGGVIYAFRRSWKWAAVAAAVILLVFSLDLFSPDGKRPVGELAVSNINITDNLSSAPVVRSDTHRQSRTDSLLNAGYQSAISGDLTEAMAIYDTIIETYSGQPVAAEAHLNKGIIQYNKGSYEAAATSFNAALKQVRDNVLTEEKAFWYLGNAYLQVEDLPSAYRAIKEVLEMDGIYRKPAERLLQKLTAELENRDMEHTISPGATAE